MENRVSETLENILAAINRLISDIGNYQKPDTEMKMSASAFTLARAYDLVAQYDDAGYIEDGEDE